jgi:diaminopimelate epimerase
MNRVTFTKMHGAGNDFVVFDAIGQRIDMTPALARAIADRHRGVGCDQILLVERAAEASVDFGYRIFNADGGEVEQCGNGARCFVRFVHDHGLTRATSIRVRTKSGVIEPRLEPSGTVTVDMGVPSSVPERVPFDAHGLVPIDAERAGALLWPIDVNDHEVRVSVVSMGNPHAVQLVADVERALVASDGPAIERHWRFPQRVNAGFMQVIDRGRLRLRVYERGAGETLACGTGACAAVVSAIERGLVDSPVRVATRGGELTIAWAGADNPVFMSGPATSVYEGSIDLDALARGD